MVVVVVMCPFSSRVSLVVALSLRCLRTGVEGRAERMGGSVCTLQHRLKLKPVAKV